MKNKKKDILISIILIIIIFIIFLYIFNFIRKNDYNYKHISGSYTAQDNSYLVLNSDKTFYWYIDKDNKDNYYYGTYSVYRGENAIEFLTKDLSIYEITEEEQRQTIENIDIKDAIDHYYLLNIQNEKVVTNGKENKIFKETRYYGFATEDYNEFDFLNVDANNYAVFIREQ